MSTFRVGFRIACGLVAALSLWGGGNDVGGIDIVVRKKPGGAMIAVPVSTDASGNYRFTNLPPGDYVVTGTRNVGPGETGTTRPIYAAQLAVTKSLSNIKNNLSVSGSLTPGNPKVFESNITITDTSDLIGVLSSNPVEINPTVLAFTLVQGDPNPASRSIQFANTTDAQFQYNASFTPDPNGPAWNALLTNAPGTIDSGSAAEIGVIPTVSQLPPGTYSGQVLISTFRTDTPLNQVVIVTLTVLDPTNTNRALNVSPSMDVALLVDGVHFQDKTFQVANSLPTPKTYTVIPVPNSLGHQRTMLPSTFTLAPGATQSVTLKSQLSGGQKSSKVRRNLHRKVTDDPPPDEEPECVTVVSEDGSSFTFCYLTPDVCTLSQLPEDNAPLMDLCLPGGELPVAAPGGQYCQPSKLYPVFTQYEQVPQPGQPISGRISVYDDCGTPRPDFSGQVSLVDSVTGTVQAMKAVTTRGIAGSIAVVPFNFGWDSLTCPNGCQLRAELTTPDFIAGAVRVPITLTPDPNAPAVSNVVSASGVPTGFAPGEPITLQGVFPNGIGTAMLDSTYNGTVLSVTGDTLQLQLPPDVPPGTHTLQLNDGNGRQLYLDMQIAAANPALVLTTDGTAALVVNADGSSNGAGAAAQPGDTVTLQATGLADPTANPVSINIGTTPATLVSATPASGTPGVYNLAVAVPAQLAGPADGPAALPITITSAGTTSPAASGWFQPNATAQIPVTIVTSPVPLSISINGVPTVPNPGTYSYSPGTPIALDVPSPLQTISAFQRYRFTGWSQGGAASQTVTPTVASVYEAAFTAEYPLTIQAGSSPVPTITTSPSSTDGYYPAGTPITMTATCPANYTVQGTIQSASAAGTKTLISFAGTTIPLFTMDGARNVNVACWPFMQINTLPANTGLTFTISFAGQTSTRTNSYGFYVSPTAARAMTLFLDLSTTASQPIAGTLYFFLGWSPGGFMGEHDYALPSTPTPTTYTANFTAAGYQVTVTGCNASVGASPFGSFPGYYPAGGTLTVSPGSGQTLQSVAVTIAGKSTTYTAPPFSFGLAGPATVVATCGGSSAGVAVTLASNPTGLPVILTNTPSSGAAQVANGLAPQTLAQVASGSLTLSAQTPVLSSGTFYKFTNFTPSGIASNPLGILTVPITATTYTANYTALCYVLTVTATPAAGGTATLNPAAGGVSGAPDNCYVPGTVVTLTSKPAAGYAHNSFGGDVPGTNATTTTVTMSGPKNVKVFFDAVTNQAITITTNPVGLGFSVDGTAVAAGPVTQQWAANSTHPLAATTPQQLGSTGTYYSFVRWDLQSGTQPVGTNSTQASYTATAPSSPGTFTAVYQVACSTLTLAATPAAGGTIAAAPATGGITGAPANCYAPGTTVTLTATPASGYSFTGWSGGATGTAATVTVTMNAPASVTANFSQATAIANTVTTSPAGLKVQVDSGALAVAPQTASWLGGSTGHTLTTATPQADVAGTTLYSFTGWSPAGPATTTWAVATAPTAITTYTANFQPLCYVLTLTPTPAAGGTATMNPASGGIQGAPSNCYAPGTVVTLTSQPATGYTHNSFGGDVPGTSALTTTVTMSGPKNVKVFFDAIVNQAITITTNPVGLGFSVDGTSVATGPVTKQWAPNSTHPLAATTPQQLGSSGTYYSFVRWDLQWGSQPVGTNSTQASYTAIAPSLPGTFTAVYQVACYVLTLTPTPAAGGTAKVTPAAGGITGAPTNCYAPGTVLTLLSQPNAGYTHNSFGGDANPNTAATQISLTMDAPKNIKIFFDTVAAPVAITVATNPVGLKVQLDSGAAQTAPVTVNWTPGSAHSLTTTSAQSNAAGDTWYKFTNWTPGGGAAVTNSITVPSTATTYTANFSVACYPLTVNITPAGSGTVAMSPATGVTGYPANCYAPGTTVTLTPTGTASLEYVFGGWSGVGTGLSPRTVVVNGPTTLTATFIPWGGPEISLGSSNWGYTSGTAFHLNGQIGNSGNTYNSVIVTKAVWTTVTGTGTITDTTPLPINAGNLNNGDLYHLTLTSTMPTAVTQFKVCLSGTAVSPVSGKTVAWTDTQNCGYVITK